MLPQSEQKEGAKEEFRHEIVQTTSLKRILLAIGSFASMVFGTYLVVFAALDWNFGPLAPGSLAIFTVPGFMTGGLRDLFLILAGIGFWIIGLIGLNIALLKKEHPTNIVGV